MNSRTITIKLKHYLLANEFLATKKLGNRHLSFSLIISGSGKLVGTRYLDAGRGRGVYAYGEMCTWVVL